MNLRLVAFSFALAVAAAGHADDRYPDPDRDILVTIADDGARSVATGINAPYTKRKRYPVKPETLRAASSIADEYGLVEIDRWPIRSLSVLCIVYRVGGDRERASVLRSLAGDARVESAQRLQEFEALTLPFQHYDDTYTDLQRGLDVMDVLAAHRFSRGRDVRVAIVDSHADTEHEDLSDRVSKMSLHIDSGHTHDAGHGTAVASVIAATANNARGIVGVAPEAVLEVYVACWRDAGGAAGARCDSFTLARALDEIVESRPDVLNLSLVGPYDELLAGLLREIDHAGIVVVAAREAARGGDRTFPASQPGVIGVGSSDGFEGADVPAGIGNSRPPPGVFAPGRQIMVAVPRNGYDFRSGSSLAAAHVSGVVALMLSAFPGLPLDVVQNVLQTSQRASDGGWPAVNACIALQQLDRSVTCP